MGNGRLLPPPLTPACPTPIHNSITHAFPVPSDCPPTAMIERRPCPCLQVHTSESYTHCHPMPTFSMPTASAKAQQTLKHLVHCVPQHGWQCQANLCITPKPSNSTSLSQGDRCTSPKPDSSTNSRAQANHITYSSTPKRCQTNSPASPLAHTDRSMHDKWHVQLLSHIVRMCWNKPHFSTYPAQLGNSMATCHTTLGTEQAMGGGCVQQLQTGKLCTSLSCKLY